jgi:lysophospholipase L1-like esterase
MRKVRDLLLIGLLSCLLLLAAEAGLRLLRHLRGEPAGTRVEKFYVQMRQALGLYRLHAFTNTAARGGAAVEAFGRKVSFNSAGYRSPERPFAKAPGVRRILCAGGSTTFDLGAADDGAAWPALLEAALPGAGLPAAEVWNAGFPGWTSAENLISFALRDGDLEPDLVIFYQGINDLQPAAHQPFDRGYEGGHAAESRLALGLGLPPIAWSERSLLLEKARDLLGQQRDPWQRLKLPAAGGRQARIPPEAVAAFERNVRSLTALARSRGSRLLLVTQPLRLRRETAAADRDYLAGWLQGLEPQAAAGELERLNEVLRRQAGEGVALADAAREIGWEDADFVDPMHTSEAGSRKLAAYLAPRAAALLPPAGLP